MPDFSCFPFLQKVSRRGVPAPLYCDGIADYSLAAKQEAPMRPETERNVADIEQAISLLRRHL
jgi:hypothetical protein